MQTEEKWLWRKPKMLPKMWTSKHQANRETDTDETDGQKTRQDTQRRTEGADRCYRHIWTEKQDQK